MPTVAPVKPSVGSLQYATDGNLTNYHGDTRSGVEQESTEEKDVLDCKANALQTSCSESQSNERYR